MTTAPTAYQVQLPVFEGPLDLLLELIERAELDITRVALAQVADQYLAYLRLVPERHLADLASFLVVAARLLQIKSEALLPRPPEREPGEEDPGDELARQLIAYKQYKQTAGLLDDRQRAGLRSYLRLAPPPVIARTLDLAGVGVADLLRAFEGSLAAAEEPQAGNGLVLPSPVTIRDQIGLIASSLREKGRTTFQSLFRHLRSRLEIVVTFLAILELLKQDRIQVQQRDLFGEIELVASGPLEVDQEAELEFGR